MFMSQVVGATVRPGHTSMVVQQSDASSRHSVCTKCCACINCHHVCMNNCACMQHWSCGPAPTAPASNLCACMKSLCLQQISGACIKSLCMPQAPTMPASNKARYACRYKNTPQGACNDKMGLSEIHITLKQSNIRATGTLR